MDERRETGFDKMCTLSAIKEAYIRKVVNRHRTGIEGRGKGQPWGDKGLVYYADDR